MFSPRHRKLLIELIKTWVTLTLQNTCPPAIFRATLLICKTLVQLSALKDSSVLQQQQFLGSQTKQCRHSGSSPAVQPSPEGFSVSKVQGWSPFSRQESCASITVWMFDDEPSSGYSVTNLGSLDLLPTQKGFDMSRQQYRLKHWLMLWHYSL